MIVTITRHARNRMRLYDIAEDDVRKALEAPEEITEGTQGSAHAWHPWREGIWLRVTFKDEEDRRVVITVTPKRRIKGETYAH